MGQVRLSYPDKKKLEAVQAYVLLGSLRQAAIAVSVPEPTVKSWKGTTWWSELESEIRASNKLTLSVKLTEIVQKGLVALNDRVANGDYVYNFVTKVFERKPISAAVANKIVTDMMDRAVHLEKLGTTTQASEVGVEARLKAIQAQIRSFITKKPEPEPREIIDVEFTVSEDQGVPPSPSGETESPDRSGSQASGSEGGADPGPSDASSGTPETVSTETPNNG